VSVKGFQKTVRLTITRKNNGTLRQVVAMAAFNLAVFAAREAFDRAVYGKK